MRAVCLPRLLREWPEWLPRLLSPPPLSSLLSSVRGKWNQRPPRLCFGGDNARVPFCRFSYSFDRDLWEENM